MNLQELVANATPPTNINANTLDVVAVATPGNKWGAAYFDGIKPRGLIVGGLTPAKVHKVIEALKGPGSAYADIKTELDRFIATRNAAAAEAEAVANDDADERDRIKKLRPKARRKAAKS